MTHPEERPPERFIPGQLLAGRYRIVERIGVGGMGEVYRAQDLKLGLTVALKFLPPELSFDRRRLEQLFAEVRLARQISHPNVCRVHDIEEVDGLHFLTMEYVDGEDLASLLRRIGHLPSDKAIAIAREICLGLAAIHAHGVVHRDLKPANVMIDGRGSARITDFGLAEAQGATVDDGTIAGTPAYMAPECLTEGKPHSVASDIYGAGAIIYELCTGRRPFEAGTLRDLIRMHQETRPASPSSLQRDVDPSVERVVLRCLDRDPGHRPASAATIAAALPGGDPVAQAIAAGRTPSPDMVAAHTMGLEGLRPALAWPLLGGLIVAVALVVGLSPRTRLVPSLDFPKPPEALAAEAHDLLIELGLADGAVDRAFGYTYDPAVVEGVMAEDRSPARWRRIAHAHPEVVTFWYRESPVDFTPVDRWQRVDRDDPPLDVPGMTRVELDRDGHLRRLETVPPRRAEAHHVPDAARLLAAAGLDTADFERSVVPAGVADGRWVFERRGMRPGVPERAEVVVSRGRLASFSVGPEPPPPAAPDPSARVAWSAGHILRPALALASLIFGAWLARRNLRAGRSDARRAVRIAVGMLALRLAIWMFGAHHTMVTLPDRLATALAWGFYDAAYGWVFYIAIEPYVRRLWPRILTSWVRLLDGRFADARLGRDTLLGALVGAGIAIAVAVHEMAPAWLGGPPGRPDNAGFVEDQLLALLGLRHQIADLLLLFRSQVVTSMGFMVILVATRIVTRNTAAALVLSFACFIVLGMPKGEIVWLNVALAAVSMSALLAVLMRAGLVAAITALLVYVTLESAAFGNGLNGWFPGHLLVALAVVVALGVHGFVRSLGGRAAIRDVLAEGS